MENLNQKHQIMESLNQLDQVQTEQVLAYIQGLTHSRHESGYQKLKREAMKEIRQALQNNRMINPSF